MEKETWKDIMLFEGKYQVSDHGRIKSMFRPVKFGMGGIRILPEAIKPTRIRKGYVYVKLSNEGVVTTFLVHRLVAIHFLETSGDRLHVNHIDFDGTNNKVTNLEWVTRSENQIHSVNNGRGSYGKPGWDIQSRKKAKLLRNGD